MRSLLISIAVALCMQLWRGGDGDPAPAPPAPPGPEVRVAILPQDGMVDGHRYPLSACAAPPLTSRFPEGAYFVEPDGDLLLLVDPARGIKREVPLVCGFLDHLPAAGSRLALGVPGDARLVRYRLVAPDQLF